MSGRLRCTYAAVCTCSDVHVQRCARAAICSCSEVDVQRCASLSTTEKMRVGLRQHFERPHTPQRLQQKAACPPVPAASPVRAVVRPLAAQAQAQVRTVWERTSAVACETVEAGKSERVDEGSRPRAGDALHVARVLGLLAVQTVPELALLRSVGDLPEPLVDVVLPPPPRTASLGVSGCQ